MVEVGVHGVEGVKEGWWWVECATKVVVMGRVWIYSERNGVRIGLGKSSQELMW